MTAVPQSIGSAVRPTAMNRARVTEWRVLQAEWIKSRTQRSTWWLLVASALSLVAAGVSPALTHLLADASSVEGAANPTGGALEGVSFTQLLVAAVGVVVVSGEYGSGLIRATFMAVPRRLPVLVAKAAVIGGLTFLVVLPTVLVTFLAAQAVLARADVSVSLGEPGVFRAIAGAAVLLAATAVVGTAFGWLVRSTAGALAATFGYLFVLPLVGMAVPSIDPYLPSKAGAAVLRSVPNQTGPSPWAGLGLFVAYTVALLVVAGYALRRRDA